MEENQATIVADNVIATATNKAVKDMDEPKMIIMSTV